MTNPVICLLCVFVGLLCFSRQHVDGKEYFVITTDKYNWYEGMGRCIVEGGVMAKIWNKKEQKKLDVVAEKHKGKLEYDFS